MEARGRIKGISRDYQTGKLIISFEVDHIPTDLDALTGCDLDITAKKHYDNRSLNANKYYWKLLGMLAMERKEDCAVLHNRYLRAHPVFTGWYAEVPDTDEAAEEVDGSMVYHLMPTTKVREGKHGVDYRTYAILKGSHEYNTKEMSVLIDALVEDCKEQGIETLPPEKIERMKASWTGKS